jgi:hypothetical protein
MHLFNPPLESVLDYVSGPLEPPLRIPYLCPTRDVRWKWARFFAQQAKWGVRCLRRAGNFGPWGKMRLTGVDYAGVIEA